MAAVKNHIIVLEPCSETLQDLLEQVSKKGQVEITTVASAEEAIETAAAFAPCMLVCSILENNHVPRTVTLLKRLEKMIKAGTLKSMVSSLVKNRQLANLITGMGVTDYIEEPAPLRTLHFKANLQLKAIDTVRKQLELKKAAQERIVFKKDGQKQSDGEAAGAVTPQAKPALEIDEDTFLFRNSQVKKQGKKFVLEMEGPDPSTGEWKQHEDKGDKETNWRWVPEEKKDAPEAEKNDGWVHEGDKPQFDETIGKWKLVSESPNLSLVKQGKKVATKVSTNEKGEVAVAADSRKTVENIVANRKKAVENKKSKTDKQAGKEKDTAAKEKLEEGAAPVEAKLGEKDEPREKRLESASSAPNSTKESFSGAKESDQEAGDIASTKSPEKSKPAEDNVIAMRDRRSPKEEEKTAEFSDKRAPETKKALSPLDFLKKKKEESQKAQKPVNEGELPPEGQDARERDSGEAIAEAEKKPKKSRARDALSALESRMKAGTESLEEIEDESHSDNEASAESEEPDEDFAEAEVGTRAAKESKKSRSAGPEKKIGAKDLDGEDAPKARTFADEVKKKEKKKAVYKEIQETLRKPLPEKLDPEEEKALRKQLGLEDAPEIDAKELAKRARSAEIKKLKQRLVDIDLNREGGEAASNPVFHDLAQDEIESTQSDKQLLREQKHTKVRAFDSEEKTQEDEESRKKGQKSGKSPSGKGSAGGEDKAKYLPQRDIQPLGGAWETTGSYYVYLQAETRYRGFQDIAALLPLWIYEGPTVPELLNKTKQWKFLGTLPFSAKSESEIPEEVKQFLLRLNREAEAAAQEEPEESKEKKARAVAKQTEAAEEAAESDEETKGPERRLDVKDLLAKAESGSERIRSEEQEPVAESIDETEEKDQEREGSEAREERGSSISEKKNRSRTKDASDDFESSDEVEKHAEPAMESTDSESIGREEDQAATLKNIFQKGKSRKDRKTGVEFDEETVALSDGDETSRSDTPLDPEHEKTAAKVSAKLAAESPAIEKFLERRKKKERKAEATEPGSTEEASNPYLGIYVCVSDVLGHPMSPEKAISKLLRSIAQSFGDCGTAILAGTVENGSSVAIFSDGESVRKGEHIALDSHCFPIAQGAGESEKILGYLALRATGSRTNFRADEIAAANKCIEHFRVLLTRNEREKEAA